MTKINGYTEDEAKELINYISTGKTKGKTLSYLFERYGSEHGRAKGSVRNYYYSLMKNKNNDDRIKKLLSGTKLSVVKIKEFTDLETKDCIKTILTEKSKGLSVRKAIANIAGDDEKLRLRLQNKYRNVLKKNPECIQTTANELGIMTDKFYLQRRLENEINSLYDKLTQSLKEENTRLLNENKLLRDELRKYNLERFRERN